MRSFGAAGSDSQKQDGSGLRPASSPVLEAFGGPMAPRGEGRPRRVVFKLVVGMGWGAVSSAETSAGGPTQDRVTLTML